MTGMRTVVLGPWDGPLSALIERRRATGTDLFDEVWEGEYHAVPAAHPSHGHLDQQMAEILGPLARARALVVTGPFNLGQVDDYRVPDRGIHTSLPSDTFVETVALVVEVVSPHDESWVKLAFFAARGVDEVVIVDGARRVVDWMALVDGSYQPVDTSDVLGVTVADVVSAVAWPD